MRTRSKHVSRLLPAAALVVAAALIPSVITSHASAGPIGHFFAEATAQSFPEDDADSPPGSATNSIAIANAFGLLGSVSSAASASKKHLSVFSIATGGYAMGTAHFAVNDLIFSSTSDIFGAGTITTAWKLKVDGKIKATGPASINPGKYPETEGLFSINTRFKNFATFGVRDQGGSFRAFVDQNSGVTKFSAGGLFGSLPTKKDSDKGLLSFDGIIVSPYVRGIPLGTPIDWDLELLAKTRSPASTFGESKAEVDFFKTARFPTDQPVFLVPQGVTVNSPTLNIVDNFFIPPAAADANVVPEPSSLVLLGIGAIGLFGYGRRRRRNSGSV